MRIQEITGNYRRLLEILQLYKCLHVNYELSMVILVVHCNP